MKRRSVWIGPIGLVTAFLFSVFPAFANSPDKILIGATVSQSGRFSSEVGPFKRLMRAWADTVNARGGIELKEYGKKLPVQFVIYDDKSDEATARRYYERLATVDKVHLMLGPYSSPLTFASSTAAENRKIPFVAVCANSPKIYDRNHKWLVGLIDLGPRYTARYWDMIRHEGKAKTVAFVVEDTLHPVGVFKGAKELAEKAGLKVLSEDVIPHDARDFTPVVAKLKRSDPDIVFVSANIPFAVNFMKQASRLQLNPDEFHCIHHGGVFREPLGEVAEYVVGQSYWVEGMELGDSELIENILDKAEISHASYPWAPAYVAAFQVVRAALEKAGRLDHQAVMQALKGIDTQTVLGGATFHKTGYGTINTYPSQIRNGEYVVIWPKERATGSHVYPRPASQ